MTSCGGDRCDSAPLRSVRVPAMSVDVADMFCLVEPRESCDAPALEPYESAGWPLLVMSDVKDDINVDGAVDSASRNVSDESSSTSTVASPVTLATPVVAGVDGTAAGIDVVICADDSGTVVGIAVLIKENPES